MKDIDFLQVKNQIDLGVKSHSNASILNTLVGVGGGISDLNERTLANKNDVGIGSIYPSLNAASATANQIDLIFNVPTEHFDFIEPVIFAPPMTKTIDELKKANVELKKANVELKNANELHRISNDMASQSSSDSSSWGRKNIVTAILCTVMAIFIPILITYLS